MQLQNLKDEMIKLIEETFPKERDKIVLGEGKESYPLIMLIGEAPGAQEVEQRRPFVGKAGKNLDQFLENINLARRELYVTNVVKFRPTKAGKSGKPVNRTPSDSEVQVFLPYLHREVEAIQPKNIVTLGNTPLWALTGFKNIGQVHGTRLQVNILGAVYNLFPLYHPAAIIYNRALKEVYDQDVEKLKEWLAETVTN